MIHETVHELALTQMGPGIISSTTKWIGGIAFALGAGGTVGAKGFINVQGENVGLRTHRNRPRRQFDSIIPGRDKHADDFYGWVGPGMHPVVPFTHGIRQISPKDQPLELEELTVDGKNSEQYVVRSSVFWGVVPPPEKGDLVRGVQYAEVLNRAIFGVKDEAALEKAVRDITEDGLRRALWTDEYPDPRDAESEVVLDKLVTFCGNVLFDNYGVELRRLALKSIARTGETVEADAKIAQVEAFTNWADQRFLNE